MVLNRDFGLSLAFSVGLDLGGSDVRTGFCRRDVGFDGTRSLGLVVAAGATSSLAADAAVGAVAELGSRTGRVGDFGRGFVNDGGDVGPGFFPGFGAGFDATAEALGATNARLGLSTVVFLASKRGSVFGSLEAAEFGDIFLGAGCLLGVAAFW